MTHDERATAPEAERRERLRPMEGKLDDALDQSFPASDPPAMLVRARSRPDRPDKRRPS